MIAKVGGVVSTAAAAPSPSAAAALPSPASAPGRRLGGCRAVRFARAEQPKRPTARSEASRSIAWKWQRGGPRQRKKR